MNEKRSQETLKLQLLVYQSLKLTILYPIVRLKFQVTAFFDVIETEMGEELYVMLGRIYVLIWEVPLWEILKAYFWIFCYLRQNQSL